MGERGIIDNSRRVRKAPSPVTENDGWPTVFPTSLQLCLHGVRKALVDGLRTEEQSLAISPTQELRSQKQESHALERKDVEFIATLGSQLVKETGTSVTRTTGASPTPVLQEIFESNASTAPLKALESLDIVICSKDMIRDAHTA